MAECWSRTFAIQSAIWQILLAQLQLPANAELDAEG